MLVHFENGRRSRFAWLAGYDAGMDQPRATRYRFRFRFGLRTLLVVVTLAELIVGVDLDAAVGEGGEQLHLESVRQIRAGMTQDEAERLILKHRDWLDASDDMQGNPIHLARYYYPNAIYCIYYVVSFPRVRRGQS